ncbi:MULTISPECIES: MetQ/NlpA family ABC transporter substrate-binding protein [unclassified Candidatus Frackibacter]|uniref:MetQ/NlpA family ABC transporter substrate-binding protein n=1 Tax=unclassified Candidatus Frackibacter TaxID=2648818 RepID=UPI00087FDE9D|nr:MULTISPECIES: MetQ/NlpA family ABC transporter substrate-binding protein [unclassified Candidatus Frackibacter]SDC24316.1 D-methionine transport system substrate-binding protein [Candidatus Frackibacter sp. WG11]SEM47693.1 D-methionine transport system substrate-binding protein [Candidatus Frackibacter sp. WG12]SFL49753.1 D-methionine transport system substrate-binding protein [Candidatus Frackibacter sp. WG13]
MLKSKRIVISILLVLIVGLVVGCSGNQATETKGKAEQTKLVVGATPVPHAEILRKVKPLLAKKGIELEIKEFTDYVTPNIALADGSIDANYFQHVPYLNNFKEERGLDLTYINKIHIEPMGLYSEKISSLKELKKGATIALPNDVTNEGRALLLLEKNGLIKLDKDAGLEATPVDIVENPKDLKFEELAAAQLPRVLTDVTAAVINTNYALEADLVPTKDAIIMEGSESPYANILAVRTEDKNNEALNQLADVLTSKTVKKFIQEKYKGAIVPTF